MSSLRACRRRYSSELQRAPACQDNSDVAAHHMQAEVIMLPCVRIVLVLSVHFKDSFSQPAAAGSKSGGLSLCRWFSKAWTRGLNGEGENVAYQIYSSLGMLLAQTKSDLCCFVLDTPRT